MRAWSGLHSRHHATTSNATCDYKKVFKHSKFPLALKMLINYVAATADGRADNADENRFFDIVI
jgi:hypothetical protein